MICLYCLSNIVPIAVTTGASDITVIENNDITFTCVFEADPTPFEYMWQFTDSAGTTMELTDDDKYIIQSSSGDNSFTTTLTVLSTVYADRGTYNCSASNLVGSLEFSDSNVASLTIFGKSIMCMCILCIA